MTGPRKSAPSSSDKSHGFPRSFDPEVLRKVKEQEAAEKERARSRFPDGKPFPVPSSDADPAMD